MIKEHLTASLSQSSGFGPLGLAPAISKLCLKRSWERTQQATASFLRLNLGFWFDLTPLSLQF